MLPPYMKSLVIKQSLEENEDINRLLKEVEELSEKSEKMQKYNFDCSLLTLTVFTYSAKNIKILN